MIPVYIFTGFLDSGKTTAIKDFISGMQEKHRKKTLLFICDCEGDIVLNTEEWLTITCIMDKDYSVCLTFGGIRFI